MTKMLLYLSVLWVSPGFLPATASVPLANLPSYNYNRPEEIIYLFRSAFTQALKEEKLAKDLYDKINAIAQPDPLIIAFRGATEAALAKHAFSPFCKLGWIKRSYEHLNMAVNQKPDDIEIRHLRYVIQSHVPGILGLGNNLEEDKNNLLEQFLKGNFNQKEVSVVIQVGKSLQEDKTLNFKEKQIIRDRLEKL